MGIWYGMREVERGIVIDPGMRVSSFLRRLCVSN